MTSTVRPLPASRGCCALLVLAVLLALQATFAAPAAAATGPTAVDDAATVPAGLQVRLAGATNDKVGSAALVPGATAFPADQLASLPQGSTVSGDGRTIQVNGHGTFQVDAHDGSVTFTGWTGRSGDASVRYRITDGNGATADGRLSVVVTAGGGRDDLFTHQDVPLSVDVLANDTPGRNADGTAGTIDRGSARFPDQSGSHDVTISPDRRTLTDPGVGVLTFSSTGILTFDPDPSLSSPGTVDVLVYSAQDTTTGPGGAVEHHTYEAALYLGAYPNSVLPKDDAVATPFNASVTLPGTTNDSDTNPKLTLDPAASEFRAILDPLPPGSDRHHLHYPGRGSWTINDDGTVGYVPPRGFVGQDGAYFYAVDSAGNADQEGLTVTVEPGPAAKPDAATVRQNVTTPVAVLDNDVPGKGADGKRGSMDPTFVRFPVDGQPSGATVSAYSRVLTVPGEGTYTADRTIGTITFDPEPGFKGTARAVAYTAQDTVRRSTGALVHNPTGSTLTVTVTAVTPVAVDNWASTPYGRPVDVAVLGNDRPGAAAVPLDATSLRLRLTAGLPAGSSLSGDAKTLTVAGRGTFVAGPDGVVVFTPAGGFTGRVPTIGYQVSDANGTPARATITVSVVGGPVLRATGATTRVGQPVVVDVLSNDDPAPGTTWDRSSVCLLVGGGCVSQSSAAGGTWSVDDQGAITYAPTSASTPTGTASIAYAVHDSLGGVFRSTLTITVLPAREIQRD